MGVGNAKMEIGFDQRSHRVMDRIATALEKQNRSTEVKFVAAVPENEKEAAQKVLDLVIEFTGLRSDIAQEFVDKMVSAGVRFSLPRTNQ